MGICVYKTACSNLPPNGGKVRSIPKLHFSNGLFFVLNAQRWCRDFKQLAGVMLCDDVACGAPCKQKILPQTVISL